MSIDTALQRCRRRAGDFFGGFQGKTQCPRCNGDWLHFYHSTYAGVEWMQCATEGCIRWKKGRQVVKRVKRPRVTAHDMVQFLKRKPKVLVRF